MYFPFLTCEIKCGIATLNIANRQNIYSLTLVIRAIVKLFRLVNRKIELYREILGFSISHDHRAIKIYGYYFIVKGKNIIYYRYLIETFDFMNGKEK
jgi:hypothetical protein